MWRKDCVKEGLYDGYFVLLQERRGRIELKNCVKEGL